MAVRVLGVMARSPFRGDEKRPNLASTEIAQTPALLGQPRLKRLRLRRGDSMIPKQVVAAIHGKRDRRKRQGLVQA